MPYFLNKGGNFIKKFKSITLASLMGLALGLYCSKYINSMKSISSEDIKEGDRIVVKGGFSKSLQFTKKEN